MKKIFTLAICAMMASAAMADVVTLNLNQNLNPETVSYTSAGYWDQTYNDADYTWLEFGSADVFMFSHLIAGPGSSWGGVYWDGFTIAIGGDQTDYGRAGSSASWTTNFGGCMAGGGVKTVDGEIALNEDGTAQADPDSPYLIGYWSLWGAEEPTNQMMFTDVDGEMAFKPMGVYVCNHPWPYYGCEHGDGFGRAFAEGDHFDLTAVGVKEDGSEVSATMCLVEYTNGELKAANDWTYFDLSTMGEVTSVYFTMSSTDTGDWGMNTSAYFCLDKFQVEKRGITAVDEVSTGKQVADVRYVNLSGMASDKPFDGMNIVVTTYTDGTTRTTKVVK